MSPPCHDLILVLGDQLDHRSPVLQDVDPARDRVLMIEARSESQRVPWKPVNTAWRGASSRYASVRRRCTVGFSRPTWTRSRGSGAPNTLGMSQYADGGLLASKPFAASGRYIQRMSNHCSGCRYDPGKSTGSDACPYTTLYWDFLMRHRERFASHPRAGVQWRMLEKLAPAQCDAIRRQAAQLKERLAAATASG